ncbi:MAG: NAD-dependent epimerase/dehydratase family protein [Candidatus Omnitrophica bacterium]|nr:NAD-dependent epimerase/dehydratase family protein [Candidatus Omnitrophota bacterium]MBU1924744.1 NAD-dependent epimerase/dehydratase family protein [Candidatus Omnitrophota bacterium]
MKKNKNILISGGAGFIGSNLALYLKSLDYNVSVLDNLKQQVHGDSPDNSVLYQNIKNKVNFILGDVTVKEDWIEAIDGQDVIVHLAAETGTGQSMYEISRYVKENVEGTAILWDVLVNKKNTIKKIVLASSRAIYGEGLYKCQGVCGLFTAQPRTKTEFQARCWDPICPVCSGPAQPMATPETAIPIPVSLYACTKLAQEQMSLTMGKALGISVAVLRLQNVYGPGQSLRNPYTGILSIFSNQLRQNLPVNIYEDGAESRDFVFVKDVVQACTRAIEFRDRSIVVNIGSGRPTSILELAGILKQCWRSDSPVTVTGAFRVGDIRHNWADLTQLYQLWPDWKIMNLDTGLAQFITWARGQSVFEDKTHSAERELKARNL